MLVISAAIMWIVKTATHGVREQSSLLWQCLDARGGPELGRYQRFLCDHNMPGRCCLCIHHPFWSLQLRQHFLWGPGKLVMDKAFPPSLSRDVWIQPSASKRESLKTLKSAHHCTTFRNFTCSLSCVSEHTIATQHTAAPIRPRIAIMQCCGADSCYFGLHIHWTAQDAESAHSCTLQCGISNALQSVLSQCTVTSELVVHRPHPELRGR